jgi:predicted Zn-dependent peptidase
MKVLAHIMTRGKNSRLFKPLQYERQIAQSVSATQQGMEIAGLFQVQVTAKPDRNLTEMQTVVDSVVADLLAHDVTEKEIENAVTSTEVRVVNGAATVQGKATALATFYSYTGNPGNINTQMDLYKGITPAEVRSTAKKFLSRPRMVLSVVPLGKPELAAQKGE